MMPASQSAARGVSHGAYAPDHLRDLLTSARTIAVVGASNEPWRPSFGIMRYLQRAGYRIVPVNPFLVGQTVHGEAFQPSLRELRETVDLVNVFRRSDAIEGVVDDAIAAAAPALWMQLGIRNDAACAKAEAAGIAVVMNRCISVEHARLCR
ncbi:MAG TPA: CoA-binding protein [Beijerinckiaceae bacterium]|nr:CoA-binding protein [Beijerinckiaceae bacterium]